MLNADSFFAVARERERIRRRREAGEPPPWTADPIFRAWKFCNVHRENDRTTTWFREHVRSKLDGYAAVEATVTFRWFNRIETGERITDLLLHGWDTDEARRRLTGVQPIVSGAYAIGSPKGLPKLEGILRNIDVARPMLLCMVARWGDTLRGAWEDLTTIPFLGPFMAYEIVSDLRHTPVLRNANDITTWGSAGPGCTRGLGWLVADNPATFSYPSAGDQTRMLSHMCELLALSRDPHHWPADWQPWEMRECEHQLCEWDKYRRAQRGESLKRRFCA